MVQVHVYSEFTYADEETVRSFEAQRREFRQANTRDKYQDYSEGLWYEGADISEILCIPASVQRPKCLNSNCLCVATTFGVNHCFRRWVEKMTLNTEIYIRKQLSVRENLPNWTPAGEDFDEEIQYAIVYNEMYGHSPSNISPAIAKAVSDSTIARQTSVGYTANSLHMSSNVGTADASAITVNEPML